MGFFGKIAKAAVDVAMTPVEVVKDAVTMGNAINDDEPYTVKRLKRACRNLEEAYEELDD